jgi:hypothetical protein
MLRGFGTVLEDLKGKAQSLIGQMLMARNQLNQLVVSSDPDVVAQAQALMAQQTDLEAELGTVNAQLSGGGDVSIADYANIGLFLVKAKTQVDAVNKLAENEPDLTGNYIDKVGIGAAIVGGIALGIFLLKKKK